MADDAPPLDIDALPKRLAQLREHIEYQHARAHASTYPSQSYKDLVIDVLNDTVLIALGILDTIEDDAKKVLAQRDYARFVADKKHELIEELKSALAIQIKANRTLLQRNTTIREERDQAQAELAAAQERERAYINLLARIAAGIGAEPEGFGYHAKHGLDVVRELFEIADAFVAEGREEQTNES